MNSKRRAFQGAATVALLGLGLRGQEPSPPVTPPQQTPPQDPVPKPEPVDPTKAAAEILKKALGLKPGPEGQPPAGPPPKPLPQTEEEQQGEEQQGEEKPAAGAGQTGNAEAAQEPQPKPQQPVDPTEAGKRALEGLLPGAKPPDAAPIPTKEGTPEPIVPGAAAQSAPPPAPLTKTGGLEWGGMLWTRYRARHGAGSSDQDLVARLSLDFGNETRDPYTVHVAGRLWADLDGRDPNNAFNGLNQSFGNDFNGLLYSAHVDAHQLPHLDLARLGRQDLVETPVPVTLDGLRLDSERMGPAKVMFSAYGGVPVHYFEATSSGDAAYGLASEFVPWQDARLRLDWMSLHDEYLALDHDDEVLGARWWQELRGVSLHGLHTWVDGKPRDLQVGARATTDSLITITIDYRELLTTQRAQVNELDPYYEMMAEYRPYRQLDASVNTDLGDNLTWNVGSSVRRLSDQSEAGTYNREFERVYTDVDIHAFGVNGLSFSIGGDYWNAQGEGFQTFRGDVEYRPDANVRVILGTGYDLFRYDSFANTERVHVRSIYLQTDYRLSARTRLDAAYEYDRDDLDEFHLFRLGVTWTL